MVVLLLLIFYRLKLSLTLALLRRLCLSADCKIGVGRVEGGVSSTFQNYTKEPHEISLTRLRLAFRPTNGLLSNGHILCVTCTGLVWACLVVFQAEDGYNWLVLKLRRTGSNFEIKVFNDFNLFYYYSKLDIRRQFYSGSICSSTVAQRYSCHIL